jgi:hypothetical protein
MPGHLDLLNRILRDDRSCILQTSLNSSSHVAPYSATYGRTPVKTLLLAADGGKSLVSVFSSFQMRSSSCCL